MPQIFLHLVDINARYEKVYCCLKAGFVSDSKTAKQKRKIKFNWQMFDSVKLRTGPNSNRSKHNIEVYRYGKPESQPKWFENHNDTECWSCTFANKPHHQ
jgi:hypothetical protein